jgi:hypothetical protein
MEIVLIKNSPLSWINSQRCENCGDEKHGSEKSVIIFFDDSENDFQYCSTECLRNAKGIDSPIKIYDTATEFAIDVLND